MILTLRFYMFLQRFVLGIKDRYFRDVCYEWYGGRLFASYSETIDNQLTSSTLAQKMKGTLYISLAHMNSVWSLQGTERRNQSKVV
jgi:hypothetical protein